MTGASPLYFNVLSGASIGDYRTAGDVKVTKYFGDYAISVSARSCRRTNRTSCRAAPRSPSSCSATTATARGRWAWPAPTTASIRDNGVPRSSTRNSVEFVVGITQALSPNDIVQSNLTYYTGHGYYSDPYKPLDTRPARAASPPGSPATTTTSPAADATLQLGYRLLFDSFGSD